MKIIVLKVESSNVKGSFKEKNGLYMMIYLLNMLKYAIQSIIKQKSIN
ncbi:MAG: hypothetical protein IKF36_02490 [Bacilli bacterium]|nr:hypothetical protein [Bacilli bacterium]